MTHEVMAKVKKCLKVAEQALSKGPVIFIDNKGRYWQNHIAREFIANRRIPVDDFMEWLLIGSSHLQNLSYGNVRIRMMGLPGGYVLVFLKDGRLAPGKQNDMLTMKEKEILGYLVKGFSNKRIASLMDITPGTVNSHLDHIYEKLRCSSRHAAAFKALKNGLFLPTAKSFKKDQ
jgi:DNA-binding CsgD family transcriptional regulator